MVRGAAQRACLRSLLPRIKDTDSTNITIPGFARATWSGTAHELRFFRATDKARGEELVNIFRDIGLTLVLQDLSANADVAGKARPNTFELWLGRGNLPASCA